ncbi:MAG TPA: MFS transporter, partial [Solirubrobacteraceae bacterium]|nr:MFS transporter [Solirubrobacteraceae bacterium]
MTATHSARGSGSRGAPLLLALTVGLVLADSSVVTLALPAILRHFDSSVNAVAWVLISFNLALALVALYGARIARGLAHRAFMISVPLFIVASLACALAPSLGFLIGARAAQGLIGAVVVAAALELLVLSRGRDRAILLWAAAGVLGAAVGPAVGGFLTEWLSWEAMFALQAPVAMLGMLGARGLAAPAREAEAAPGPDVAIGGSRPALAPLISLTLASAALSAALFLLVILLIEGWRHSPAEAALTVTVMPAAALIAGQWARARHGLVPAIAGSILVAGGLAALGLMPGAHAYWSLAPQLAIGTGLGLALATLIGASVGDAGTGDERTAAAGVAGPAAWTVAARHAGIVVGLLLLTPIFTADLEDVRPPAERAGLARVLDAPLPLSAKIELARELDAQVRQAGDQELPDLDAAFAEVEVSAAHRPVVETLHEQLNEELDRGATEAFSRSFLIAALLALLAAGAAFVGARGSG